MERWQERFQKAVTFSYDDGITQDERLVNLLNRYGMKCTFNLNSGYNSQIGTWQCGHITVRHLDPERWADIYQGHEAACHTVSHPNLYEMTNEAAIRQEIAKDKVELERIFGIPVCGMAYPFGGYTEQVKEIAAQEGIRYARTTRSTHNFQMQTDLLAFAPTCHHDDPALFDLAEDFIRCVSKEPQIFYI